MRVSLNSAGEQPRRGVTLVEMLVVVGLLVLVMTILVGIFRQATEAINIHQVTQQLDQDTRRVETNLRADLDGATATFTPPLNPADNKGYFTVSEGEFADAQGEDSDDILAFTAQAQPGRPFTGHVMVPQSNWRQNPPLPPVLYNVVPVSSDYAEIIYFARNGNLYRRVFLILPPGHPLFTNSNKDGSLFQLTFPHPSFKDGNNNPLNVSWLGMNDVSARPKPFVRGQNNVVPSLNTLGDLTNRENRAFARRFANDYFDNTDTSNNPPPNPDGFPDDYNGDGIDDWYPTMYYGSFNAVRSNSAALNGTPLINWPNRSGGQVISPQLGSVSANMLDLLAFPYEYPNAYSKADPFSSAYGFVHTLDSALNPTATANRNHYPIDEGDPLPRPSSGQTWWGLPTKRETLSPLWGDPIKQINNPSWVDGFPLQQAAPYTLGSNRTALPPMTTAFRYTEQTYTDGSGSATFATIPGDDSNLTLWKLLIDEDLVLTNVRSFDVKVLDPYTNLYVDLGFNDVNPQNSNMPGDLGSAQFIFANSLGHEGRMPPLTADGRLDSQFPYINGTPNNVGDDAAGVRRLRRVYDTWSTDYTHPPYQTLDPSYWPYPGSTNTPPLPGYSAPYPAPLRAIQVQIRVVDPKNSRLKSLTIRHDFTDRLQ